MVHHRPWIASCHTYLASKDAHPDDPSLGLSLERRLNRCLIQKSQCQLLEDADWKA
jgi:hypothetical protein